MGTRPRYRWLLASERSWHMLVNSLLQKHDVDTLKFSQVCLFLVATGISSSLSCSGTCTCRNIDSISEVRAIGPSRNLNIVPINPCSRSGPANNLSFRHISLYFAAALQTRRTLPGLLRFSTGWCGKYHSFPKVPLSSDLPRILTSPFSTSVSIDL